MNCENICITWTLWRWTVDLQWLTRNARTPQNCDTVFFFLLEVSNETKVIVTFWRGTLRWSALNCRALKDRLLPQQSAAVFHLFGCCDTMHCWRVVWHIDAVVLTEFAGRCWHLLFVVCRCCMAYKVTRRSIGHFCRQTVTGTLYLMTGQCVSLFDDTHVIAFHHFV